MAHHVEPMDIDSSVCDFDNKENSFHHSNVLPRTPCTEKGYEELDVSELNMKLRYSVTPVSSPMSKSYTANCLDNRNFDAGDNNNPTNTENTSLTRSLNSTMNKGDIINKPHKLLPLQVLPADQLIENRSVLRPLESTVTVDGHNITVTVSGTNEIDENISFPSSSSSMAQTPEATTPTIEGPRNEGGSPIIRGLKSVLNIFRSSQSPIPPAEDENAVKPDILSPPIITSPECTTEPRQHQASSSTPLIPHKTKDALSKGNSPNRDSIVFNDDLEKELLWKDETTIIFSQEKIPIHKLFFQQTKPSASQSKPIENSNKKEYQGEKLVANEKLDSALEFMDVLYNDSVVNDNTLIETQIDENLSKIDVSIHMESDSEFVDCETTFTKDESQTDDRNVNKTIDPLEDNGIPGTCELTQLKSEYIESLNDTLLNEPAGLSGTAKIINSTSQNLPLSAEDNVGNENFRSSPDICGDIFNQSVLAGPQKGNIVSEYFDNVNLDQTYENNFNLKVTVKSDSEAVKNIGKSKPNVIDISNTVQTLENKGIKSISQIPLIVDPRVLLFNIPLDLMPKAEGKVQQFADVTNTSPADVPLPNDDDSEKCATVSNVSMKQDNTSITNELISDETILRPAGEIDAKPTYDQQVIQNEFLFSNILIRNDANESQNILLDYRLAKTERQSSFGDQTVNENLEQISMNPSDIETANIDEIINDMNVILNLDQTLTVSNNMVDNNVVSGDAFISEVEVPNVKMESPELSTVENINTLSVTQNIKFVEQNDEPEKQLSLDMYKVSIILPTEPTADNLNVSKTDFVDQIPDDTASSLIDNLIKSPTIADSDNGQLSNKSILEVLPQAGLSASENAFEIDSDGCNFDQKNESEIEEGKIRIGLNVIVQVQEAYESHEPQRKIVNSVHEVIPIELNIPIEKEVSVNITSNVKEFYNMVKSETSEVSLMNQSIEVTELAVKDEEKMDISAEVKCEIDSQNTINKEEVSFVADKDIVIPSSIPTQTFDFNKEINDVLKVTKSNDVDSLSPIEATINDQATDIKPNMFTEIGDERRENIDEEILASESNSPFVSVTAETELITETIPIENLEKICDSLATQTKTVKTPPSSPKIVSKGYNFNFDEIEDPFATKTKIRASPPPGETPNQSFEQIIVQKAEFPKKEINKNRRKSQPEKKKSVCNNKKNLTFSGTDTKKGNSSIATEEIKVFANDQIKPDDANRNEIVDSEIAAEEINVFASDKINPTAANINEIAPPAASPKDKIIEPAITEHLDKTFHDKNNETINKDAANITSEIQNACLMNSKDISSSEQSNYFAGSSSNEGILPKNVFNLPEIDDMNFNPFVTKSKMCQSPPPSLELDNVPQIEINVEISPDFNPFVTKSKVRQSPPPSLEIDNMSQIQRNVEISPDSSKFTESDDTILNNNETDKNTDHPARLEDTDASCSLSNTTCSSKATDDKDLTVREIHTEDEDTVEGPFLEAEDLKNDDKLFQFEGESVDMMHFGDLQTQGNEEEGSELFIDAQAFEFLLNQHNENVVADSGKESLFLKFDPLFARRVSSDSIVGALNKVHKRQSTPKKSTMLSQKDATFIEKSPFTGPSVSDVTQDPYEIDINDLNDESNEDLNITVSKPMMVVNPAVNPVITPRNRSTITTPARTNRRSLTFTSPAIAVIDRLISLSANNSLVSQDSTITEVRREQNEADLALTQLRELLADKEINVYNLRSESKELKERLISLESQMKTLESISEERLKKINELTEKLSEKTKINKSMATVVEEYERTIASLIAETEQDKKRHAEERIKLIKDRDEQTDHLTSMEVSFSDLHSKYEKSKQVIIGFKANEESYKKSLKEFEENLTKMQTNYELLKQHATSKLNHANDELLKMNRTHEAEVLKLSAMIKRKDLHITSLEESLLQKSKANEELTAICDELINKVG